MRTVNQTKKLFCVSLALITFIIMAINQGYAVKPISINAGAWNTLILIDDGTVWGMGYSEALGNNICINNSDIFSSVKSIPIKIGGLNNVTSITTGAGFCIALKNDGSLWAWGLDNNGQIGVGGIYGDYVNSPIRVSGLDNVIAVDAYGDNALALCDNGSVWIWGSNQHGQIPNWNEKARNIPLYVQGLPKIKKIAMGDSFAIALDENGIVWGWGYNAAGELGDGTRKDRNIPSIVGNLANVKDIDAGSSHIILLKDDGTVWTCGGNTFGQLGNGKLEDSLTPVEVNGLIGNIAMLSAGGYHNIVLMADGTVWTWGNNKYGQLGIGVPENQNTSSTILAGTVNINSAPPNDYLLDDYRSIPVQVPGLININMVSAGELHTVTTTDNGTIWTWGSNSYGQLGDMPNDTPGRGKPSIKNYPFKVQLNSSVNTSNSMLSNNTYPVMTSGNASISPTDNNNKGLSLMQLLSAIILLVIVIGIAGYYFIYRKK